jgi:PIN domain nuclease of toxin-antitoxin system
VSDHYVLDASAVLCLIRAEPGYDVVKAALPNSSISAVNLGEVVAKMNDIGMDADLIMEVLDPLQLKVIPFDAAQAHASGLLRRETRSLGLSFGDRACLALAAQQKATALTTDRAWSDLQAITATKLVR